MNNELIERIDAAFENRYRENSVVMGMASVPSVDYESLWMLLQDCKAALTQQQEAEPVAWMAINKERPERVHFSSHQTYMENLAAYPGSTEFWDDTTLYLRPPKPAAQQQEAEPVAYVVVGNHHKWVHSTESEAKSFLAAVRKSDRKNTYTIIPAVLNHPAAQPQVPEGFQQIGWTNAAQVSYVKDESGSVYPDQDHGCDIPVFIPAAKEEGK